MLNPDGTFTYTPDPGFVGVDTFSYVVCNGGTPVICDTAQVFTTVNGAPVAVNDTVTTPAGTPLNGNVATNDTCGVGPCTYSADPSDPPTHGTVTINPDGTFTYTPDPGYNGYDTLTYVVCNGGTPAICDTAMITVTVGDPLPVDLVSFTAKADAGCDVLLSWISGVESNFSHFEIEAGTDGATFVKAGEVAARGSGSSYTYAYRQGVKGKNYFRLKQVDRDGSFAYSRIVSANLGCEPVRHIRVYPTITEGQVTVDGLQPGEAVQVYDMKGITLQQTKAERPELRMNLSRIAAGSYMVIVTTLNGDRLYYKVVKK